MSEGQEAGSVDFVVIGHVTRDDLPEGGWRLGGATYLAVAALRLGHSGSAAKVGLVTSGPPEVIARLREAAPGLALAVIPTEAATTFENRYDARGVRTQYLRARAADLPLDAVPLAWRSAPVVVLAPFAQEVAPEIAAGLASPLLAATPQGWLRRWRPDGVVLPCPPDRVLAALPALRALILSREDLVPRPEVPSQDRFGLPTDLAGAEALIERWAEDRTLIAETRGAEGARVLRRGEPPTIVPAYPAREVDPTGAGDVFATAFLLALAEGRDPLMAADFANRAAALSIEHPGYEGIPTREEIEARGRRE